VSSCANIPIDPGRCGAPALPQIHRPPVARVPHPEIRPSGDHRAFGERRRSSPKARPVSQTSGRGVVALAQQGLRGVKPLRMDRMFFSHHEVLSRLGPSQRPPRQTADRKFRPPTLRVVVTSCETNPMDRMFFTPRGPRQPRTKTTCTTSGRDLEGSEPNRRVVASSCETFPDGSSPAGAAPSPSPIIRPADRRP
jgi:hypothetical protein